MKFKGLSLPVLLWCVLLLAFSSCRKESDEDLSNEKSQSALQLSQSGEARSCHTHETLLQQLEADPSLKTRRAAMEEAIERKIASRSTTLGIVTIPIVVHVVYNTPTENISEAQILSQIAVLNDDFARTNADAANTPAAFQVLAGNATIQFTLAKRDPSGNPTTGIIRKYSTVTSWGSNGAVKLSSMGGSDAWPYTQYLNIWVCNLSGSLGYATYPGGNPIADGAVIRHSAFGNTGTVVSPYNKGRTATHEIGHWLNLYHIWGDALCGDDLINDSPTQQGANYGCPVFPRLTCSNTTTGDMFMNYMDYSNDACMNMFTLGQTARMAATLAVARASIVTSLGGIAPGGGTTCNTPAGLATSSITTSGATVSWGASGAASYNLRYKATTSATWINATPTAATSQVLAGLASSTAYEFQVQGSCSGTLSAYSASGTFTTSAAAITCNVPGALYSSAVTANGATLYWGSSGASNYNVRYKATTSATWMNTSPTAATSQVLAGLASSTTYEFQVQSVCSGATSAYSASAGFTTSAAAITCNVPGGLYSSAVTANGATVYWGSTGAANYTLRYKATSSATWVTFSPYSATSRVLTTLASSTTYEYQVQSACSGATSAFSASAFFTTGAAAITCNVPGGLYSSAVTANGATLYWGSSGAANYNVRYKPTSSGTWLTLPPAAATSRALSGLASSTTYEFQVQSDCSGATSAFSSSVGFTTAAAAITCNIPGGLNASSITLSGASLYWGSTGAVSYNVRYKATASATWLNISTSATSAPIGGLASSTSYEFQVQSVCSGTSSAYSSSAVFTTSAAAVSCNIPSGLASSFITSSEATLNWASTGAVSYNVRYKTTTSATWVTLSSTATSRILTGLAASTIYEFQVQSVCSGSSSAYSTSAVFTTAKRRGNQTF